MVHQSRNNGNLITPRKKLGALIGFLTLTLSVMAIGGMITATSVSDWYQMQTKPPLTPPDAAFGPVWGVLYILMAVAAWQVWLKSGLSKARTAFQLFGIQLGFNLLWSFIFFGLQCPAAALVIICFLWGFILATAVQFYRIRKTAGYLLAPYLFWVTFAVYLNAGFWWLNGCPYGL